MVTLEDIKNELDITYNDPATDRKLTGIMRRADSKIRKYAGIDEETEMNPEEEALFVNYCLYDYNKALEMFETNYQREINEVRAFREVEAMAAAEEEGVENGS